MKQTLNILKDKVVVLLVLFVVMSDQIVKRIVSHFADVLPFDIIKGVFSIYLVNNTGGAFGIFRNVPYVFLIIPFFVSIFIIFLLIRLNKNIKLTGHYIYDKIALSLILAGALSNFYDRLRFGYVIDYLDFKVWPVFNIADIAISTGVILLCAAVFFKKKS